MNIRLFFEMLDTRVAELKQLGGGSEMIALQRQECYILANNFIGDPIYGNTYLTRMVRPFMDVMNAKIQEDIALSTNQDAETSKLKYLVFFLHDTNVSNFLRFLGYWISYGYDQHVKFASSVRLEVFRQKIEGKPYNINDYKVRVVYDNKEISLPYCKGFYCTFVELYNHVKDNLGEVKDAEHFCKHGKGE